MIPVKNPRSKDVDLIYPQRGFIVSVISEFFWGIPFQAKPTDSDHALRAGGPEDVVFHDAIKSPVQTEGY